MDLICEGKSVMFCKCRDIISAAQFIQNEIQILVVLIHIIAVFCTDEICLIREKIK